MLEAIPSDGDAFQLQTQFGRVDFRNGTNGNVPFRVHYEGDYTDFRNSATRCIKTYSNAAATSLRSKEFAIDTNRGGTGTTAWLYRDASGTTHYWDADGTL